jgi:hypothetical protein
MFGLRKYFFSCTKLRPGKVHYDDDDNDDDDNNNNKNNPEKHRGNHDVK